MSVAVTLPVVIVLGLRDMLNDDPRPDRVAFVILGVGAISFAVLSTILVLTLVQTYRTQIGSDELRQPGFIRVKQWTSLRWKRSNLSAPHRRSF